VTIIPSEGDSAWIDGTLPKIKEVLDSETLPSSGKDCEFCPYREAAGKKLQAVHAKTKK
jgi:hypothetical protein